jgi:hypothetical protein
MWYGGINLFFVKHPPTCDLCNESARVSEVPGHGDWFFVDCSGACPPYVIRGSASAHLGKNPGQKAKILEQLRMRRSNDDSTRPLIRRRRFSRLIEVSRSSTEIQLWLGEPPP